MSAEVSHCPNDSYPMPEGVDVEVVNCTELPAPLKGDTTICGVNVPKKP